MALLGTAAISGSAQNMIQVDRDEFSTQIPENALRIVGQNFIYTSSAYGYAKKQPASFQAAFALDSKKVESLCNQNTKTEIFLKQYEDICLLERSHIDPERLNLKLLQPKNYLNPKNSLLGINLLPTDNELPNTYKINSRLIQGHKFLELSFTTKPANKNKVMILNYETKPTDKGTASASETAANKSVPWDMQIDLTSSHDKLYALITAYPKMDFTSQAKKEKAEHSIFKSRTIQKKFQEDERENLTKFQNERAIFLNNFRTKIPTSSHGGELALYDSCLNLKIQLPKNWAYAQIKEENEKKETVLSLAMPQASLFKLNDALQENTQGDSLKLYENILALTIPDLMNQRQHKYLKSIDNSILTILSYQNKGNDPYKDYLKDSDKTNKTINDFMNELGKTTASQNLTISDREFTVELSPLQGVIKLNSKMHYHGKNNNDSQKDLQYLARIGFNKNTLAMIGCLSKTANPATSQDLDKLLSRSKIFGTNKK